MPHPLRLALIGASGHIAYVLSQLDRHPDIRVTAVVGGFDPGDSDRLLEACRHAGHDPAVCADLPAALKTGCDLACIDGPFDQHATMARQALAAGAHVLVEKPIALEHGDLQGLRDTWRASRRHLLAMHGLRYDPAFFTAHALVTEGAIGAVRLLHAQKSYRLGRRPQRFLARANYGGTIPWVGSHGIDWIRWFARAPFRSVTAHHNRIGNRDHGDLEATAACLFSLEGGISATLTCDYLRPESAPSHGDDRLRVVGTDGIIEVRAGQVFLENADHHADAPQALRQPPTLLADVLAILAGQTGVMNDDDAFAVTEACLRAREAADSGTAQGFPGGSYQSLTATDTGQ